MEPKLEDEIIFLSKIALDLVKSIDVPGVENERLLADSVGAYPQGEAMFI